MSRFSNSELTIWGRWPWSSYFCRHCGTRLLHSTPNKKVVSVKGGCIDGLDWTRAIHIWTKSAMVPIPEGVESYPQEEEDRRSSVSSSGESYASSQEFLDQPSSGPYLGHTVPGPGPRGAAVGANASAAAAAAGGGARTSAMDEDGVKKDPSVKGLCELSSV
ncbi:uncharacterized protein B0I36DRAFT_327642 [Microdochium trichocladiopsis]|uniref:CENP-V/GFA domain-containing protein n=1 Tax=Microdochium trichocladiopsis TaxID=1682393 RepID=A0A9P9BNG0_9PEZI|nr:uncharacterized protein B0I36DRAFT_327642 [Microdochium trichocladiopsis]KAH7027686.1 hypothetical protein B0I36DRAFT_327642 [Microdochium trichocladiopsis]